MRPEKVTRPTQMATSVHHSPGSSSCLWPLSGRSHSIMAEPVPHSPELEKRCVQWARPAVP